MLQPLQLKDVSARYADEISELRDFLQKTDCEPETVDSLHTIANRLQRDRAFHRDLTSYIWVVIYSSNRNISYADLLGVLAIAAAGTRFASEAHEDDAHALLRFVMEARQSLDGTDKQKNTPAPPAVLPPQSVQPRIVSERAILQAQTHPLPAKFPSLDAEDTGSLRKRFIWIAACVLAALSTGLVLHYRTTPDKVSSQAPAVTTGTSAPMEGKENIPPDLQGKVTPSEVTPSSATTNRDHAAPPTSRARNSHEPLAKEASTHPAALQPHVTPAAVATTPTPASNISPPLIAHSASTPAPIVSNVPAVTSPAHPASSSSSTNSSAPDLSNTIRDRQVPPLLRRTPAQQVELAASSPPSDIAASKSSPTATNNTPRGTVQAISLGTNAANVLYSPTPDYPIAASTAHVQGEVKLQANVDRKGNVASVRVISGPPLLREAALDAAQRWRYRPDIAAGEPIPMSAITVFEFQLP